MSRWKAACIHFAISFLVIAAVGSVLVAAWYPPRFIRAVGGLGLIAILAGVQITLGPLLTLLVFKSGKRGLKFDLAAITLLQVLALAYGIHVIALARPVYVVFVKDRFEVLTAAEIPPENLDKAQREEYRSLPLGGPKIVAARKPEDTQESQKILFSAAFGGPDLSAFPQYYEPYSEQAPIAAQKSQSLEALLVRNETNRKVLEAYLRDHDLKLSEVKFLPLQAKQRDQTALVDATSGALLGIIDLDPW